MTHTPTHESLCRPTTKNGGWPRASLAAAVLLTGTKLGIGMWTNSLGILSEAAHSGLDLVAAAVTLWAVRVSSRPADREHPYGHGKIENLSALFETVLLLVTCLWIIKRGDRSAVLPEASLSSRTSGRFWWSFCRSSSTTRVPCA